jgi:hypothetical protein
MGGYGDVNGVVLMAKTKDYGNFKSISAEVPFRLIWVSSGREKVGKNHFGLTSPGPICGQYFDPGGLEGVAEKFLRAPLGPKEIRKIQYRFNKKTQDQEYAKDVKAEFIEDYHQALTWARTIQWDETELWELCRFAEWGRESARGREYGPLNGEYRGLIQDAYDAGVNLQLIQKVKEKWVDDKPSGEMKPVGFTQAQNIVQINLAHTWDAENGFQTEITNCRQNMALAGMVIQDLTYAELGQLVFDDSDEQDWL